jgi:EmrB/QacA subfamily drug resistance transporter
LYLDPNDRTLLHVNQLLSSSQSRRASSNALLFVVCLAQFMVILDIAIVNVALPSMGSALHFSTSGLQWVVNAYTITFAGFLMLGGRCADLLGRRRVFLTGTVLFSLCSLACSVAESRGLLIGARALQGLGGAVLSPATLSIITSSLPEGPERNRGLAAWGAVGALGGSSGALLGGLLTQTFGWPAIFAVNVPVGALVVVLALRLLPRDVRSDAPRHFDVTGALLITLGLVSISYGIVRTDTLGWGSLGVLGPLAVGIALVAAFVLVEARFARAPLVPLSIFRIGQLRAANGVVVLLYAAVFPQWFFLTLYMQRILHYDAIVTGLGFMPMTMSVFAGSTAAPRLVARFGPRGVITAGMATATVGDLLLTGIAPGGSYFGNVLVGGVLAALGMGCSLVPATIVAMQGVPRHQSGLASGLLNTSRLIGGALGLAILSTIATAQAHGALPSPGVVTNGYDVALTVGGGILIAGVVIAGLLLRPRVARELEPTEEAADESEQPDLLAA